ncbi:hypothetical protein A1Q1_00399 [Trichosporon asahii var. asahii CBS 2479]|uniref:Uncharacterized protein n=1 Tax=Trichosporon asahii var. asahii (strain ATCC 90039 / CBS 2479 / JCM 2466 / KCTC 7840 / NBRC 103889/ NCYC 2677 / UAMH 7654) TaxID=1186058 RepID=J6F081_TRIAS|nr:hypothetical protein A1Q1_00399 [Trichosporon asahii var. asahii CBS 2479]EJT50344.1 hypothetical protein A1Q1_00399 [Trichosporon asahii var. asahii CBS 2479]
MGALKLNIGTPLSPKSKAQQKVMTAIRRKRRREDPPTPEESPSPRSKRHPAIFALGRERDFSLIKDDDNQAQRHDPSEIVPQPSSNGVEVGSIGPPQITAGGSAAVSIAVAFPKSGRAPDGGPLVGVPQPARARTRTDSEASLGSPAADLSAAAAQSASSGPGHHEESHPSWDPDSLDPSSSARDDRDRGGAMVHMVSHDSVLRVVARRRGLGNLDRVLLPFPREMLEPFRIPCHKNLLARLRVLSVPFTDFHPETAFIMVVVEQGSFTFGRGPLEGGAQVHYNSFVVLLQVLKEYQDAVSLSEG